MMAAVALFAAPETASAQSFWNWGHSDYIEAQPAPKPKRVKVKRKTDPAEIAAKQAAKPQGPLVITVSIEKQRVKVYDSNGLFAEAAVSTGTRTHPTPSGVFSIIQKNKHHVSNLYNASMPYMQRITWSGVAMHTGPLPGYAASHGCIRLPNEFAARLWTWTKMGTRVIVAPGEVSPTEFTHAKLVTKMAPQPNVSAAPAAALAVVASDAAPAKVERAAVRRTADASEAIAGMKGTLSDANAAMSAPDTETKKADAAIEAKPADTAASETPAAAPSTAEVKTEATTDAPAVSAETKPVDTDSRETAAKAQEPVDGDKAAEAKPADTKAAETAPSEVKPAEAAQTTAQPASDIVKPAETKPADIAAETAKPVEAAKPVETAKPVDAATPSDIAKPADIAAPGALPDAVKPIAAKPRPQSHVAVFISRKDKKLYVRQGYEPLFDVPVEIADIDRPLGTHVFTARGDKDDSATLHWTVVSLPQLPRRAADTRATRQGKKAAPVTQSAVIPPLNPSEALDRITIPADAMDKIAAIIAPGGSLLISDHGLNGWETGRGTDFIVPLR